MKKTRRCVALFFALMFILNNSLFILANNTEDVLLPYKNKLSELNQELGTNYKIPSENELSVINSSMNELTEFYTSMDMDEFKDYIINIHNLNISFENEIQEEAAFAESDDSVTFAEERQQFYFYSKVHWFYLKSKMITVNNVAYYNSFVEAGSGFDLTNTYPQYYAYDTDYSVSSDSRKMSVTYYCTKYLSENLIDTVKYTIPVTYTAEIND